MANEIIIKDDKLAKVLEKELLEKGGRGLTSTSLGENAFTEEELSRITKLDLKTNEITSLEGLENCVNLKDLQIISPTFDEILEESLKNGENNLSELVEEKEVLDLTVIGNLKSLEILTIKNNTLTTSLDLKSLKDLKALTLENNRDLIKLEGLEDLQLLEDLSLLKNPIENLPELQALIEQSNLKTIEIDMDAYPQLVEKNPELATFLEEKELDGSLSIQFKEDLGLEESKEVPLPELKTFEESTKVILANIIEPDFTDVEKIAAVYSYLTQNVMYSQEMEETQDQVKETDSGLIKEERPELEFNKIETYSALTKEEGNIRGYANLMHYMLISLKIDSKVVGGRGDLDTSGGESSPSNAVLRARVGNDWFYFDPALDRERKGFENFYKTKDEFRLNHVLSGEEYDIKSPVNKGFTNFELEQTVGKVSRNIEMNDNSRDSEQTSQSEDVRSVSTQGNRVENVYVPEKTNSDEELQKSKDINAGKHTVEDPNLTPEQQKLKQEREEAIENLEEAYEKREITKDDLDVAYYTIDETIKTRGLEGAEQDLEVMKDENESEVVLEDEIDDYSEGREKIWSDN